MVNRFTLTTILILTGFSHSLLAEQGEDLSKAREALSKQEDDADTEKALEEVFEAAEKNYSLLKEGGVTLNYNFDYSYYGDQRLDLVIEPTLDSEGQPTGSSTIKNADVSPVASHTFTNSFSLDYGLFDNITLGARLPLIAKFDTEDSLTVYSLGDISTTVRYQPFEYIPGKLSQTWFGTFKIKTGESPYEIDTEESLSTGSGYYTLSGGVSASKVLDPVVLFGSASYGYNVPETDLNQVRGSSILKEVHPGNSLSFSMGFAYSLSYDVSLSASFQGSYNDQTKFVFSSGGNKQTSTVGSQMTGIMNFALGVRVSPKTIANVNVGFGMTELSPDIILGLSLPIDIEGVKAPAGS
ncbi:MAG: flagellar protein FilC [Oceanospirillaceae bacterium]|nr:flagellar protein FilC [Oceanospirillaceae bacterium]MBT13680.1 flagellar protein FilC [Oceanospirillaceae bacterium]|tara:strand:- start:49226 stop:50287 length:1062 start_codon:yes stop_codon:yes gene_type:complete